MKNFLHRILLISLFCCGLNIAANAQCTPEPIPYTMDFEDCYTGVNATVPCWTKMQASGSFPYPVLQGAEQCLAFSGFCIISLPEMSQPLSSLRISFDVKVQNTNNQIIISIIDYPDWSESESIVDIDTITLPMTSTFYHQEVHFDGYTGNGRYILIQHIGNTQSYIDNVVVDEMPDCLNPVNVQASNVGSQSATLTWTEAGNAAQWRTLCSTTPISNFSGTTPTTVSTPSISYNTLTPNTTYYFYVQSVCGSDYSAWSSTIFTTTCGIASLPLQESFTYGEMPACWSFQQVSGNSTVTFVSGGQNPFVSPAAGEAMAQWASGSYQAGRQGRLVTPEMSTTGTNVLDVNFKWYHGSEGIDFFREIAIDVGFKTVGSSFQPLHLFEIDAVGVGIVGGEEDVVGMFREFEVGDIAAAQQFDALVGELVVAHLVEQPHVVGVALTENLVEFDVHGRLLFDDAAVEEKGRAVVLFQQVPLLSDGHGRQLVWSSFWVVQSTSSTTLFSVGRKPNCSVGRYVMSVMVPMYLGLMRMTTPLFLSVSLLRTPHWSPIS